MAKALSALSATAQNTQSAAALLYGRFNLSISGTFVATVTLQRSFDQGSTWLDVATYSVAAEDRGEEIEEGVLYRLNVKTGAYTSGTVVGRLSQ